MAEATGVLGEIVARKKIDVAERLGSLSLESMRGRTAPSRRSLRAALARPGARFIMEVKRASPSGGSIRDAVDPAAQVRAYGAAADAVSVLTDTPYFGGSLRDLEAARRVFDGPILAKDFVVDPRQVPEARAAGADAVLVMLSVLDDKAARAIIEEAGIAGMEVLVEAHDEAEVKRALALDAPIVGINNRDLRTLEVDLATTERLSRLVPKDRLLVSESGIGSRADAERLGAHADAFLVGSSLMRAEDPSLAARALVFGRVKVCGLCSVADVEAACAAGAAQIGLIFAAASPRRVTAHEAESLAAAARAGGAAPVGVFVDAPPAEIADLAARLGLAAVQLHGAEDEGAIRTLRRLLSDETEIWAACPVGDGDVAPRAGADRILFDTRHAGRSGGTGRAFDWGRVADRPERPDAILAGGLSPANAAAAAQVGAWALDANSGVESAPGRKDPAKLAAFFESLRVRTRQES